MKTLRCRSLPDDGPPERSSEAEYCGYWFCCLYASAFSFMRTARFSLSGCDANHLLDRIGLISPRFGKFHEFVQRIRHRIGIDVVRNAEIESVIVGLALLFLRELCAGESGGQFPQLGIREFRGGASFYRSAALRAAEAR